MSSTYRVVTIALLVLTTMIAFEGMAITTVMPMAAEELRAVSSYGLAFSAMMTAMLLGIVVAGAWGDRAGPLPVLYAGQILFGLGCAVCAVAATMPVLLAGRVVTGMGGGLAMVAEFLAIGRIYPLAVRPKVFAWLSAAWVLPSVLGAPLAGWLAHVFSWRAVFWAAVAPAVVSLALIVVRRAHFRTVAEVSGVTERAEHIRALRLGSVVALGSGAVQYAIHEVPPLLSWPMAIAGLGLVGLGVAVPRLLPAGTMVAGPGVPAVIASRALFNGAFMGTVTFIPLGLVLEYGLSASAAGAVISVGAIGWSVGSWIQGRLGAIDVERRKGLVVWGAVVLMIGATILAGLWAVRAPAWSMGVVLVPMGLAMGMGSTSLSVLVLELSLAAEHANASSALQLADVLGTVVSVGAATAAYAVWHRAGSVSDYVWIFAGFAALAAIGILAGRRCAPTGPDDQSRGGMLQVSASPPDPVDP